ncbi:MAG: hypothetical protein ACYSU0_08935 [Planctomycetota bacterium]|jgi:hypothetical protein
MGTPRAGAASDALSWKAGAKDVNGARMNGTEIMKLTPHKGKLFAATSMWMESDASLGGCQLLVKEGRESPWKVELQFGPESKRLTALEAVEFRTDRSGDRIEPVRLLLAGSTARRGGTISIRIRNDETGEWAEMPLGKAEGAAQIRAIGFHRDRVTGVEMVFAGVSGTKASVPSLGLLTGSYRADAEGRMVWNPRPEIVLPRGERFMGFTVCNGAFYAATSNHIFKRTDGKAPTWKPVYHDKKLSAPVGIRGLATVPAVGGDGEELIFISWAKVRRLNPAKGNKVAVELDIPGFLADRLALPIRGALAGYNKIIRYRCSSGAALWLIGFQCNYNQKYIEDGNLEKHHIKVRDDGTRSVAYFAAEGRYLIRSMKDGTPVYRVRTIEDPERNQIGAVRTICPSPFEGDRDVLYMGGVDSNGVPGHDTGWIFRVELRD